MPGFSSTEAPQGHRGQPREQGEGNRPTLFVIIRGPSDSILLLQIRKWHRLYSKIKNNEGRALWLCMQTFL